VNKEVFAEEEMIGGVEVEKYQFGPHTAVVDIATSLLRNKNTGSFYYDTSHRVQMLIDSAQENTIIVLNSFSGRVF
jgi:hypothetical protein